MRRLVLPGLGIVLALSGCAASGLDHGTLAELDEVAPDVDDIHIEDSLERAAESYRRYLAETSGTARTPEAMRRLADLQIEQASSVSALATGVIESTGAPARGAGAADSGAAISTISPLPRTP